MSDKDEPKANERDRDDDRNSESEIESESESEREPAAVASKTGAPKARTGGKRRAATAQPVKSAGMPGSSVGVIILLALVAGGAAGWFGHIQTAKAAAAKADSAPMPAGSSGAAVGSCGAWEKKICTSSGADSAACMQAKGATDLLTPSACDVALSNMPATLNKLKAARASCDKLVGKLCADLPPGSQMCAMVKDKTPSFPAQRCDEMLSHYDEVIGQLKQMEAQQGGMMGGPGAPGGPGGPGAPGGPVPNDGHGH
jgi:hypothetical protein